MMRFIWFLSGMFFLTCFISLPITALYVMEQGPAFISDPSFILNDGRPSRHHKGDGAVVLTGLGLAIVFAGASFISFMKAFDAIPKREVAP